MLKLPNSYAQCNFIAFENIEYILKLFAKDIEIPEIETQTIKNDTPKVEISQNTNGQLGLFAQAVQAEVNKTDIEYNSKIITDSQDLCELIEILSGKKVISFKLLADFQNAVNFKIYGIALGFRDDISYDKNKLVALSDSMPAQTFYIPILHNLSKQLDLKFVLAKLKPILENNDIKKLTHDVKIEECMLNFFDIDFSGVVFDTMLASYIKDSNANSDFDIQCMEQINHILPTIVSNTKKSSLADNDVDTMKNYSGDVMASLFELTLYWVKLLEDKEYEILTDIEIPLAYVLAQMESNGVSIDKNI